MFTMPDVARPVAATSLALQAHSARHEPVPLALRSADELMAMQALNVRRVRAAAQSSFRPPA